MMSCVFGCVRTVWPMPGVSLTVNCSLIARVRLLVRLLNRGDQVDAEADDAQRALVGRGAPCSPRSPRRRTAPRSRGRRAPRARRPVRAAGADPSGCRSCSSVSFRKWSNPNSPGPGCARSAAASAVSRRARSDVPIRDLDAFIDASHRRVNRPHRDRSSPLWNTSDHSEQPSRGEAGARASNCIL